MIKKLMVTMCTGLLALNLCGCVALLAGAAGGAGTAVWLSGKMTQQFKAPYDRTIEASKSSLQSMGLPILKETREPDIAQLRSKYSDDREVWVDIRPVTDTTTRVEVRVGTVSSDKEAASLILKKIQDTLTVK
jgi:hypothetical protein